MGFRYTRMSRVEDDVHVIGRRPANLQIIERLLGVHVLERDHVNGARQVTVVVVGEKRPGGECRGIDIQCAEPGDEVGERDERADFLVLASGWLLKWRR